MLNKMILIGEVVDSKRTKTNKGPVVNLCVKTRQTWRDRQDCQVREQTERHHVIVRGLKKVGYANSLKIGSVIYVQGLKKTSCHIAGVTKDGEQIKSYRCVIEAAEITEIKEVG